jgi:probable rRNA maturation factor
MLIDVNDRTRGRGFARFLSDHLARLAERLPEGPDEVSVVIVDDTEMGQLHERFLNDPLPTDVLTFEGDSGPDRRCLDGEVVVCIDVALRQAAAAGRPVEHELLLYALHGLLHLSGYDDRTQSDYSAMHAREDELLTAIGIGPVFEARDDKVRDR